MSDEEYCGVMCMAARRCGIGIHRKNGPAGWTFSWYDNKLMKGKPDPDQKQALKNACELLNDYFNQK